MLLVQSPRLCRRVHLPVLRRRLERSCLRATGRAARMAAAASLLGASACGYSSSYGTSSPVDADSARAAAEQATDVTTSGAAGAPTNSGESGGGPRDGG
jgi:hypothetical protein